MTITDRDWTSAIRGKLAGINQRAQAVHGGHASAGRALAALDHEASHHPGSGGTGPRSSDTPDPTHSAAIRPRPPHPSDLEQKALTALDTLMGYVAQLERWAADGNPNPRERRTAASPCRGGTTHYPRPDGKLCALAACGKPWPCRDGETESWFEECDGTVPAGDARCTRCQLSLFSAVCRDCSEVKDLKNMRNSTTCNACRMRAVRAS